MFTEIRIGTGLIKTFFDLTIEQNFNSHHRFSFYIPNDKEDNGIALMKDGIYNHIGKEVTIKWGIDEDHMSSLFNGLITGASISTQESEESNLLIVGYSSSYAFSDLPKTRSFFDKDQKNQKQTLESVVKDAVKDAPADPYCKVACQVAHDLKLPYVVQYKESTFDFLNRLALRYGEWFYVDGKTLHFGNAKEYKTHDLLLGSDLLKLEYDLNIQPVGLHVRGYNHQLGDEFTGASAGKALGDAVEKLNKTQRNIFRGQSSKSLSWQPNSSDEVKKQGEYQYQEQLAHSFTLRGECDKSDIKLGDLLKFKIKNPSENDSSESLNECRVISITHHMKGTLTGVYTNTFKAIAKNVEYLPVDVNNIPSAYDAQPEYAKVVSTEDANGRVQVAFFWNEDNELSKSFFMPCLSSYAGGGEKTNRGILFIPEVGDTVLVGYYQSDPHHPYVMGGLHNSKTAKLKDDNKNNEIKSITTSSGHVIEFNDKKDAESVTITDKEKNIILMNKDGVVVKANKEKNIILMSKDGIKITDDTNKNSIEMGSGGIVIKAEKDVKINAQNIKQEAQSAIEQKAGPATIKLGASGIEQSGGSGSVKIGASGVDIQGPMVKIS